MMQLIKSGMKLVSMQSSGNRLIVVEANEIGWCYLRLAKMGKKRFQKGDRYRFYSQKEALAAAAVWLRGAKP